MEVADIDEFISEVRDNRLLITRKRVAGKLRALRTGKSNLRQQEKDKMEVASRKLKRVLAKFKELGYKIDDTIVKRTKQGEAYFTFEGTHGISKIKGKVTILVYLPDSTGNVEWTVGDHREPMILLTAQLIRGNHWSTPRICRITYRKVMRTTNEILQVLLRGH